LGPAFIRTPSLLLPAKYSFSWYSWATISSGMTVDAVVAGATGAA
jgi:hypothetical protein